MRVKSGDTEISYEILGTGAPVVLLHPFPANRGIWRPVADVLARRYTVILPDLRGHGESPPGEGAATMEKHAQDVARVCDEARAGRAVFAGCSIGGYILMEFWRRHHERVRALALCNTKATADTAEARAGRLQVAEDVLQRGSGAFLDTMIPKLIGETTRRARPDLVSAARAMMEKTSVAGIAAVQRGMAERPDSVPTLQTIDVPTLIVGGEEDTLSTPADVELMQRNIRDSQLRVVSKAGHYAPFEQAETVGGMLRQFLADLPG